MGDMGLLVALVRTVEFSETGVESTIVVPSSDHGGATVLWLVQPWHDVQFNNLFN